MSLSPELDAVQFEQSHQRDEIERLMLRLAAIETQLAALQQRMENTQ